MPDQSQNSADPFDSFESVAEIIGFTHLKEGLSGVKELLAMIDEPVPSEPWLMPSEERARIITQESLEDAAEALTEAGLKSAAKLVCQTAAGRPREIDLPAYEPGSTNHRAWLAKMKRQGKA